METIECRHHACRTGTTQVPVGLFPKGPCQNFPAIFAKTPHASRSLRYLILSLYLKDVDFHFYTAFLSVSHADEERSEGTSLPCFQIRLGSQCLMLVPGC